jgi:hypothetical protein
MLAGAAGGIAGNLVERGLRGQRVDLADLAVDAAFGAAGGGLAGGAGKLGTKVIGKAGSKLGPSFLGKLGAGGKAAARRGIYGRADLIGRSLKQEVGRGFVRGLLKSGFERGAEETGAGEALGNAILNGPTWLSRCGSRGAEFRNLRARPHCGRRGPRRGEPRLARRIWRIHHVELLSGISDHGRAASSERAREHPARFLVK